MLCSGLTQAPGQLDLVMFPIKMLCCQLGMLKQGTEARGKGLLHRPQCQPIDLLQALRGSRWSTTHSEQ